MKNIIVSAGMANIVIKILDGYTDDKIKSCKYVSKTGINCLFEVETDMSAEEAAAYIKKAIKATPQGATLYFSVKPQ